MKRTLTRLASPTLLGVMFIGAAPALAVPPVPQSLASASASSPEGGWIWEHPPLERFGARSLEDAPDAKLHETVARYRRRHVIDDARVELRVGGDLESLIEAFAALQLLASRGRLDVTQAATARELAFHVHAAALAATRSTEALTQLDGLLKWRLSKPEYRATRADRVAMALRGLAGHWFLHLHSGVALTPVEHLRSGRFAASEGDLGAAVKAFGAAWDLGREPRAALLAHKAMLEDGQPEAAVQVFETRASAVNTGLAAAFDAQRRDVADAAANAAWLKGRPPLSVAEGTARALALARLGQPDAAIALAEAIRGTHPTDPVGWRLSALLHTVRGDRDVLRGLFTEAAEEGLMKDDRLREGRLLLLVNGGESSALERELGWLARRSPRDAVLAEVGRGLPLMARAAMAREKPGAESAFAPLREHLTTVVARHPGELEVWGLAVAGFGAMRALETESATLRGWLGSAPPEVGATVEGWLALTDAAYALRARDPKAVGRARALLETRATASGRTATEDLLLAATRLVDTELGGGSHSPAPLGPVQAGFEVALQRAEPSSLARQAALVGIATTLTQAGRSADAVAAWRAVRGADGSPFLAAIGTAWSLMLEGEAQYASLRAMDASELAEGPHERHYALLLAARGLEGAGQPELLGKVLGRAADVAREAELPAAATPARGLRAIVVSRLGVLLETAWEAPLKARINLDPVVALLPLP